jgi:hypothetical protein
MNRERVFRRCCRRRTSPRRRRSSPTPTTSTYVQGARSTPPRARFASPSSSSSSVKRRRRFRRSTVKGKVKRGPFRLQHQADLEEGLCPPRRGRTIDFAAARLARGERAEMAVAKSKPTSAGPPSPGAGRQPGAPQGCALRAPAREAVAQRWPQQQRAASPRVTLAAVTSSTTGSSTSSATRMAFRPSVERIEYDPNRTAHIALLLFADGERRYIIAPRGLSAGDDGAVRSEAPIKVGQLPAAAQHPGRLHRALRSSSRSARARSWRAAPVRRYSWPPVRATTPPCVCVPARCARCCRTAAPRSARCRTPSTTCASSARPARALARCPPDGPRRGHEPGRPPARWW